MEGNENVAGNKKSSEKIEGVENKLSHLYSFRAVKFLP